MTTPTTPVGRVRAFFARPEGHPYAGGDLDTARRLGALLWVVATGLTWVLLPLAPPDGPLGGFGWPVAIGTTLVGLAGARWTRRGRHVTWDHLLVTSYLAAVQIMLLEWLAGSGSTPYGELYLLIAMYAGALHPPRRLLGVLAVIAVGVCLPLAYGGVTAEGVAHAGIHILLMTAMALLAAVLMRNVRAQRLGLQDRSDQAERLARVDMLTELPNRRAFGEALSTEIARARRFGSPLSLVVADLDGFKQINDAHGHPAGDACLRSVAEVLRASLRRYDACFRWGGDEFVLLLPETEAAAAEIVCRRAAAAVAGCSAPGGEALRITCAPAQLRDGQTGDDLVAAADEALLARKRGPGLRLAQSA